jgi:hypothetical protein
MQRDDEHNKKQDGKERRANELLLLLPLFKKFRPVLGHK